MNCSVLDKKEQCGTTRKFCFLGVGRQACCRVLGQAWDQTGWWEVQGLLDATTGVNDHLWLYSLEELEEELSWAGEVAQW